MVTLEEGLNLRNAIDVIHHINKMKEKSTWSLSIKKEEAIDKIQHIFMVKALIKPAIEGTFLNMINSIYEKPTANIILNGERLKAFHLWSGMRQGCLLSPLLFNTILLNSSQSNKTRAVCLGGINQSAKEGIKLSLFANDMILYNKKYPQNPKESY